mgnify:FL=1
MVDNSLPSSRRSLAYQINSQRPILAPMDGISDQPFRTIARQFGAGMLYTEFINAIDVVAGSPQVREKMRFTEFERPIGIQLFDDRPSRLLESARIVEREFHPDFIDLNFSCPDRRVTSRGAGAALLGKPEIIREMVQTLVREINLPISAKFRIGFNQESINFLETARIIEESGASHMAVHGRSADQGMLGKSNWDAIRQVKLQAHIPVIGNGDILSPQDIESMLEKTACDAVMIGRGAVGNPWLFNHQSRDDIDPRDVQSVILQHLDLTLSFYGTEKGMLVFRKHFKQYSRAFHLDRSHLESFLTSTNADSFIRDIRHLA